MATVSTHLTAFFVALSSASSVAVTERPIGSDPKGPVGVAVGACVLATGRGAVGHPAIVPKSPAHVGEVGPNMGKATAGVVC